jgi:hypothetical protein
LFAQGFSSAAPHGTGVAQPPNQGAVKQITPPQACRDAKAASKIQSITRPCLNHCRINSRLSE